MLTVMQYSGVGVGVGLVNVRPPDALGGGKKERDVREQVA